MYSWQLDRHSDDVLARLLQAAVASVYASACSLEQRVRRHESVRRRSVALSNGSGTWSELGMFRVDGECALYDLRGV